MSCQNCGQELPDQQTDCPNCTDAGESAANAAFKPEPPNNYLVFAILATIFCCWPLGIPAIVYAAQVNNKFTAGDFSGAMDSSGKAKLWCFISLGGGVLAIMLWILITIIGVALGD